MQFLPFGTVYGTLLNFRSELDLLGAQMHQPPYKAPPVAPVLYVKTANTWTAHGRPIALPARVPEVEVGATIGMVMGGPNAVASYVLLNDLCIPHASFFRPPVRFRCVDGFLGVGATPVVASPTVDPGLFTLRVSINGQTRQHMNFSGLVRDAHRLLADVSDFMTLRAGDVLTLGSDAGRPLARPGDRIDIHATGFETLSNTLVAEAL